MGNDKVITVQKSFDSVDKANDMLSKVQSAAFMLRLKIRKVTVICGGETKSNGLGCMLEATLYSDANDDYFDKDSTLLWMHFELNKQQFAAEHI